MNWQQLDPWRPLDDDLAVKLERTRTQRAVLLTAKVLAGLLLAALFVAGVWYGIAREVQIWSK